MEKTNRSVLTTRYFVMIITMIMMLFAGTLKEPTIVEAVGSASAELDAIYIDGIKLENFDSGTYDYIYEGSVK